MRRLLLFGILFLISLADSAGSNDLQPGYVVTNDRDTIRGYILSRVDAEMAFSIHFSEDETGDTHHAYTTSDLLGFGFESGRIFERKLVNGEDIDASAVFAKKVVSGKVDMWIWRKKGPTGIFLKNRASDRTTFLSGPDPTAVTSVDGSKYSTKHVKYTSLIQYVLDDPLHAPSNKKIRYSEKSISNSIQAYNTRYSDAYPVRAYKDRMAWNVDVTLGLVPWAIGRIPHVRVATYASLTNLDKTRRWSYIAGATYLYAGRKKSNDQPIDDGDIVTQIQIFSIMPLGARYQNTGEKVQFYVHGGLGIRLWLDQMDEMRQGVKVDSYTDTFFIPIMLNLGAGLRIKAGSRYILTEFTPSMHGGFFLNVGYRF